MTDIHSCSYYCDRPECIKAQRDELRERLESMTDREIMQRALEALEWVNTSVWLEDCYHAFDEEVAALRDRLAQPEQEPESECNPQDICAGCRCKYAAQPEQEPLQFKCTVIDDAHPNGVPLSQWGKQPEQEPVTLPCCGYADASAVKWNPYSKAVQCHNCGQTYTAAIRARGQDPMPLFDDWPGGWRK